jgi:CheY-like chemotaxis protein
MSKLILHLDDEPAIREVVAASLTDQGYRVVSVATPREAFSAIAQERPDLLITDLQLDEGDGLEVIAGLRAQLPGIPIVILSGVLIDPRVAEKSVASLADLYLPKTSPLGQIMKEIRRLAGE